MITIQLPIVEIIRQAVEKVRAKLLPDLQAADPDIETVHFEHGPWDEIIETLQQYDKSETLRYSKYPLIALVHDFPEERGNAGGKYGEANLMIVIAHHTNQDYKSAERYTESYLPVLYPLYGELITQLSRSPFLSNPDSTAIRHIKTDKLHWGRNTLYSGGADAANVLSDHIDAIELRNLRLTIKNNSCSLQKLLSQNGTT
jgi:hypothetical protein